MATVRLCKSCGAPLPADAPEGLCPQCLIKQGLDKSTTLTARSPQAEHRTPNIEHPTSNQLQGDKVTPPAQRTIVKYFGDYELLEEIARGGMGVVYKARQVSLNRIVALKMILAGQFAGEQEVQRFHTEAEAAANLDHPNIVAIYEVGEHDGRHYFSMQFVHGGSLSQQINRFVGDPKVAATLMVTVARAVHYAHQHGILHRDLKPANILLDGEGQPHVTDFGLAKRVDCRSDMTLSGAVMGTPHYMAPEQAAGHAKHLTTAADIYSLGAILYQLLTGRPPFEAETPLEAMRKAMEEEPQKPSAIQKSMDKDLETICLKCLEKDLKRRYGSAEGLADDLKCWLRHEPILARRSTAWERSVKWVRRKPVVAALSCGLALVALAGLAGIFWEWRQSEQARQFALEKAASEGRARLVAQAARQAETEARQKETEQRKKTEAALLAEARMRNAADNAAAAATLARQSAEYEAYVARIGLAASKIENHEYSVAEEALDNCPQNLRHWEWGWLNHLCHLEIRTYGGVGQPVVSQNGKYVVLRTYSLPGEDVSVLDPASGEAILGFKEKSAGVPWLWPRVSADGEKMLLAGYSQVRILDLKARKEIGRFQLKYRIQSAAWYPDATRIALAGADGIARVVSSATGEETLALRAEGFDRPDNILKMVWDIVVSPNGKRIVTGGEFSTQIWDAETGRELSRIPVRRLWTRSTLFSPDGKRIFAHSGNGPGEMWATEEGRLLFRLEGSSPHVVAASFSADGRFLATANLDSTATIWDAQIGKPVRILRGHGAAVRTVAFSRDGGRILTASDDRTASLWETATGRQLSTMGGHSAPVLSAVFREDQNQVVTTSRDNTAKLWSLADESPVRVLRLENRQINSAVFSPRGEYVLAAGSANSNLGGDDRIGLWESATGKELFSRSVPAGYVSKISFTSDGKRIIGRIRSLQTTEMDWADAGARMWNAETGAEISLPGSGGEAPETTAISPDGRLFFAGKGRTANIWNIGTGQKMAELQHYEYYLGYAMFSPDGRRLVAKFNYGDKFDPDFDKEIQRLADTNYPAVRIWNTETGAEVSTLRHYMAEFSPIQFLEDSTQLISSGFGNTYRWDVETGQLLQKLAIGAGLISPDKKTYCGSGYDGTTVPVRLLKMLDFTSGTTLAMLKGHREDALPNSFSPDGLRLMTSSSDGTAKLWDTRTGRELLSFRVAIGKHSLPVFSPDGRRMLMLRDDAVHIFTADVWKGK